MSGLIFTLCGLALIAGGGGLLLSDTPGVRRMRGLFERTQRIERVIYRHHRLFGGGIVAGASLLLALLGARHAGVFGATAPIGAGIRALVSLAWVLAAVALVIGVVVLVRPSALKGVEALANRWISLPAPPPPALRKAGILLLIAGIACLGVAAGRIGA
jgi:hypothetical protein